MANEYDDDEILAKAKRRFKLCEERERDCRMNAIADIKFAHGDSENGWQYDQDPAYRNRAAVGNKPLLTINKTRQHNLQIINELKQNKPRCKVIPAGGETTYEAAQVMNGLIRHIEYQSNAEDHYENAFENAVEGGIGYWRVITDYADDESFDQEIFIKGIKDVMSVYMDPDIQELDGSDAMYAFIYNDISKEKFEDEYPEYEDIATAAAFGTGEWLGKDNVRIAEYYYIDLIKDTIALVDGQTVYLSQVPDKALRTLIRNNKDIPKRKVKRRQLRWCKIIGDKIVDQRDLVGKYIPVVRCVGEEVEVGGEYDRKGHTRYMKDPQRMYNYWTSAAVEFVALQGKTPYIAPVEAIDGLENYWGAQNIEDFAFLPYNAFSEDGTPIPAPQRQVPPTMSAAYIQGMQVSSQELKDVSGQQDAKMGTQSNETSGIAIARRQAQSNIAEFGFVNNFARAIRLTGKIIIDIAPKIYDTRRVVRILAEDGTESRVLIDPNSPQIHAEQQVEDQKVETIFNPGLAKFDVMADIGASFQTRRQESFAAISQILAQNPALTQVIGDLLFKSADFYMADDIAERIGKTIPDAIKNDGPSMEVMQMQEQMQQAQQVIQQLVGQLSDEQRKRDIDVYKAQTDRLKAYGDNVSPEALATMIAQTVINTLQSPLVSQEEEPQNTGLPPVMPQ